MNAKQIWLRAVSELNWTEMTDILDIDANSEYITCNKNVALRRAVEKRAPIHLIKAIMRNPFPYVDEKMLMVHIDRTDVVALLLTFSPTLYCFNSHWLLHHALIQGHLETAEHLLACYYTKNHHDRQVLYLAERNDYKSIKVLPYQAFELIIKYFPDSIEATRDWLVIESFFRASKYDRVIELMQQKVIDPFSVYDGFKKLYRNGQLRKSQYYEIVDTIATLLPSSLRYKSVVRRPFLLARGWFHTVPNKEECVEMFSIKPLLNHWNQSWPLIEKNIKTDDHSFFDFQKILMATCGYTISPASRKSIVQSRYKICLKKAWRLAFGLADLQLAVLLLEYLYYSVAEPKSNCIDLHIVNDIFCRIKNECHLEKSLVSGTRHARLVDSKAID